MMSWFVSHSAQVEDGCKDLPKDELETEHEKRKRLVRFLLLLLLHPFLLLCGVDVSYETPPFSPVFHFLPWQFSLRQVVPGAIQPPPLCSASPSFPRHLHPHHSLPYVFVFSSQYMPISLQPTFLHLLGYFSYLRYPFNSFIPNFVHLGDSTHPS